jgi:hypothetical protein
MLPVCSVNDVAGLHPVPTPTWSAALPPGPTPGFQPGSQIIQPSRAGVRFSAGRDARLYGRQDARRYHKMRIRSGGWAAPHERQKKRNCYFGYFWLFLVIFIAIIHCNILYYNILC